MPFTPYPVPARAVGSSRRIPVGDINQAILFSQLERTPGDDGMEVSVELPPDHREGGYKVKWGYGIIGILPVTFRELHPQFRRLTDSQLTPEVTALIEPEPGETGGLRMSVLLPEPEWCIPVNDPLEEAWALLPPGPALDLDPTISVDVDEQELRDLGRAHILVELIQIAGRVTALYDGRVLAVVTEADSAALIDALNHFEALGLQTMARAFLDRGKIHIECARTADLGDEDLEPEISPLEKLAPEPEPQPGMSVAEDGSWSVHMPSGSFPALTPEQISESRNVVSPVVPDTEDQDPFETSVVAVVTETPPTIGVRAGTHRQEQNQRRGGWWLVLLGVLLVILLAAFLLLG